MKRTEKHKANAMVSLKTLALELEVDPRTVRRWMAEAGIQPVALSDGPRGAVRYLRREVTAWLESRPRVP